MNKHLGKLMLLLSIVPFFVINLQNGAYEWFSSLKLFLTVWSSSISILSLFVAVKQSQNKLEESLSIIAIVLSILILVYVQFIKTVTTG